MTIVYLSLYRETSVINHPILNVPKHPILDDFIIIQYWMNVVISLWMILVWNKFHPKLDDFYHSFMDGFCII